MEFNPPRIIGIVNITEDSFSDGGRYLKPQNAIRHSLELIRDGADVLDLGPASSHPDSVTVSARQEIERLEPVVAGLKDKGIPLSVDSCLPETQRWALAHDVSFLNDIQGFPRPEIYSELAAGVAKLIMMHSISGGSKAGKAATNPEAVWKGIERFFDERLKVLERAGIAHERIIIDPGMGFFLGTNPEPSLIALRSIPRLKQRFSVPVMVCVSRKSFLGAITSRSLPERASATLAAELYAAFSGVDYIRTHDVRALRDGLKVLTALAES